MFISKFRGRKGITLIALVITIIVLLILAGVTIAMVVGDNGILKRSNEAKDETTIAKIQEEVDLAVADLVIEYQTRNHVTSNSNSDDQVKAMDEILVAVNESDVTPSPILDEENDEEPGLNSGSESDVTNPSLISGSESDYISDGSDENITPGTAGAYVAEQKARLESKLGYEISFTGRKITVVDSGSGLDTSGVMEDSGHIVWNGKYVAGSGANSSGESSTTGGTTTPEVSPSPSPSPTTTPTASAINASNYGQTVNYSTTLNGVELTNWKLFYQTGNYVWLIYGDYLENAAIPAGTNISKNGYRVYASSNRSDLINYLTTKSNWSSLLSGTINGKAIDYTSSTEPKITAMGSPTMELYRDSWNAKYPNTESYTTNQLYIAPMATAQSDGLTGYYVSRTNPATSTSVQMSGSQGYPDATHADPLYYPHAGSSSWYSTSGFWLASPSAYHAGSVMRVNFGGYVDFGGYNNTGYACRPVVCLPSSVVLN